MIQVKNITKKFPTVTALDCISLTIREKEFFGLLGPNGAGKTTLMNLLVGYLDPDEGEIVVGGEKVTRDNLHTRKNIGLVPQSLALYDDISAEANLEIFFDSRDELGWRCLVPHIPHARPHSDNK